MGDAAIATAICSITAPAEMDRVSEVCSLSTHTEREREV
jgi:hypothetical protein